MKTSLRHIVTGLLLSALPAIGCATETGEQGELGDTIVDGGAADSWSRPTAFGQLFQRTWQFAEIDPDARQRMASWEFSLGAASSVTVSTRVAPTDEPTLLAAVVYLYQQRDVGTWKRIAKSDATGFGSITRDLEPGQYRVIVKGVLDADAGEAMVRLDVDGAGRVADDQCILGDQFYNLPELKHGALMSYGSTTLTAASSLSATAQAQIIAAVNEATYDVTTLAEAFAAVDQEEIYRYRFYDNLAGRSILAFEFGAGDNSYGALFAADSTTVGAGIHDGEIDECKLFAKACVFGRQQGETAFMPDMKQTGDLTIDKVAQVPNDLTRRQIIAAVGDGTGTIEEALENVDENTVYVETFQHTDGREFVNVRFYSGDTAVGTFFTGGTTESRGTIGDGEIDGCTAY